MHCIIHNRLMRQITKYKCFFLFFLQFSFNFFFFYVILFYILYVLFFFFYFLFLFFVFLLVFFKESFYLLFFFICRSLNTNFNKFKLLCFFFVSFGYVSF